MKKKVESLEIKYKYLWLQRKELDRIIEILEENYNKVNITIEDFELDNKTELDGLEINRTQRFSITGCEDTYISSISFRNTYFFKDVVVHIANKNNVKDVGVLHKIDAYLKGKHHGYISFIIYPIVLLISTSISFLSLKVMYKYLPINYYVLFYISTAIMLFVIFVLLNIKDKMKLIVHLKEKEKSFYQRNKDAILLAIFGAILGLMAGIILAKTTG